MLTFSEILTIRNTSLTNIAPTIEGFSAHIEKLKQCVNDEQSIPPKISLSTITAALQLNSNNRDLSVTPEDKPEALLFLDLEGALADRNLKDSQKYKDIMADSRIWGLITNNLDFLRSRYGISTVEDFVKLACWNLKSIEALSLVTKNKSIGIVVTSKLRENRSIKQLQALMELIGISADLMGKIENDDRPKPIPRSRQILNWSHDFNEGQLPFVVVDSEHYDDLNNAFGANFVYCPQVINDQTATRIYDCFTNFSIKVEPKPPVTHASTLKSSAVKLG